MPRFDRTGPEGKGPNTGRGLGDCNDNTQTDEPRQFLGFRLGLGRRRRNGRRRFWKRDQ